MLQQVALQSREGPKALISDTSKSAIISASTMISPVGAGARRPITFDTARMPASWVRPHNPPGTAPPVTWASTTFCRRRRKELGQSVVISSTACLARWVGAAMSRHVQSTERLEYSMRCCCCCCLCHLLLLCIPTSAASLLSGASAQRRWFGGARDQPHLLREGCQVANVVVQAHSGGRPAAVVQGFQQPQ